MAIPPTLGERFPTPTLHAERGADRESGPGDPAPPIGAESRAPKLETILLSCPAIPGTPYTDCGCPEGSTVFAGGAYAPGNLLLKESRPISATAWRMACQTTDGAQVACAVSSQGTVWIVCGQVD
jgi:hypothetical protein